MADRQLRPEVDGLLIRLEDAISNIDFPGSDAPLWESKAKRLARELAELADPVSADSEGER